MSVGQDQDYGCEITQDLTSYENAFENIVRNNPYRLKMLVKLPKQRSHNSAHRTSEHNDESVSGGWSWSDNCVTMASLVPPFKKGVPGCLSMLIGIIYSLTSVDTFQQPLGLMRSTMPTRDIQKY